MERMTFENGSGFTKEDEELLKLVRIWIVLDIVLLPLLYFLKI